MTEGRGMRVVIGLKSPLHHGSFGVNTGTSVPLRRMTLIGTEGELFRVPALSGNALRGRVRRSLMRELFGVCEIHRGTLPPRHWDRLYAALANGGHLDGSERRIVPEDYRTLRDNLPVLSVLGAALYTYMLPSHCEVGIAWLRCRETVEAGICVEPGKLDPPVLPAEDLVEEISHTRHIEREHADPEETGVTPMPVTLEVIMTGATLESEITFPNHATELERAAIAHGLDLITSLGGKSAPGLGQVSIGHDSKVRGEVYQDWLSANRESSAEALRELAAKLA